jgi:hypothetical protein
MQFLRDIATVYPGYGKQGLKGQLLRVVTGRVKLVINKWHYSVINIKTNKIAVLSDE